ncbi:MAG: FtsH protease activity modulator HflK [Devosia sp.]
MPWDNNTGGGGRNNNNGGPWGQPSGGGNSGGGGGGNRRGGGGNTPNLEDILSRGRNTLQGGLPGGRWTIIGAGLALVAFWVANSVYTVDTAEVGVELQFGRPKPELSQPGLHFLLWPVETVEKVSVAVNQTPIGGAGAGRSGSEEGLMLTGDQNIADVRTTIFWSVSNPIDYLFNVRDPEDMVRLAGESAMREVVGRRPADDVFRDDQGGIATQVQDITQSILNSYGAGVTVSEVNIEYAAPPAAVVEAFNEVQRAGQEETQVQEAARREANTRLGNARGQAASVREAAAAYSNRVVQEATGEAERFNQIYAEYVNAPDVTRQRLFLETMEQVLGSSQKVFVEGGAAGSGVIPYLPLPELRNAPASAAPAVTTDGVTR